MSFQHTIVLTRGPFDITLTIEGADISITGRDEAEVYAALIRQHAAQVGIGIVHKDAATATPAHLAAVLNGDVRDAIYGPVPLATLFRELPPDLVLRNRVNDEQRPAAAWATAARAQDAGCPCFLMRYKSRGARTLEVVMEKSVIYSEVATSATPGAEPSRPPPPATPKPKRRPR